MFIYFNRISWNTVDIRVNVNFRRIGKWADSAKRADHVFDRMRLRGIGIDHIAEAVRQGAKTIRKDGSILARHKWFCVVYREFRLADVRKIYPITVMEN